MYGKKRRSESPYDEEWSQISVDLPNYHHVKESPSSAFDELIQPIQQQIFPSAAPILSSNRRRIAAPVPTPSAFDAMMRKTTSSKQSTSKPSIKTSPVSSKKRRRISPPSSIPDSSQTCLDLGQTPLAMTECSTCSFQYQRGQSDDEKMHKDKHDQHVNGYTFDGWKQEPIISQPSSNERILCLEQADLKHREHSVRMWIDRLHKELGHCRSPSLSQSSIHSSQSRTPQHLLEDDERLLVYIKQRRVIGLMIVKLGVNDARRIDEQGKSLQAVTETEPSINCPLGIDRICVLESQRRRGIATRLLNAATAHCISASVDPSTIAFSQPTQQGRQLAQHYTKQTQFLAYV